MAVIYRLTDAEAHAAAALRAQLRSGAAKANAAATQYYELADSATAAYASCSDLARAMNYADQAEHFAARARALADTAAELAELA